MTFTCEICKQRRLANYIAVATERGDVGGVEVERNVNYCADSRPCEDAARLRARADIARMVDGMAGGDG